MKRVLLLASVVIFSFALMVYQVNSVSAVGDWTNGTYGISYTGFIGIGGDATNGHLLNLISAEGDRARMRFTETGQPGLW